MSFRKIASLLPAICLVAALLCSWPDQVKAAGAQPARFIAIVYDDSGSMRYDNKNRDVLKNYIYANYSLQNLAALMEPQDTAKIYLISKKGKNPVAISGGKDLNKALMNVGSAPASDTYAETVNAAMHDGAAFLQANPDGGFLFVMITDGATMYDEQGKQIKGSLKGVFDGYLKGTGLGAYRTRTSALLLSIGTAKPLAPVSDLQAVLNQSGIRTGVFLADISKDVTAGDHIMSATTDLAESMASTNMMQVESRKAFAIRYPLESLVVMEQFQQSSESLVQSIQGSSGDALVRSTLYTTKAIGGVKLASTFSSIKAASGSIKPGEYTIKTSGKAKLMAFSKIGFTTSVSLTDESGREVAAFSGNRWSVDGITLPPGGKLSARVSFVALDGTAVEMDPHVKMEFGSPDFFACKAGEKGAFMLEASQAGQGYLEIGLNDPDYFQIAIPPLAVTVNEPGTVQPSPSPILDATVQPSATASAGAPTQSALDTVDLAAISGQTTAVEYTSSNEYIKAAEFQVGGTKDKKLNISVEPAPPPGLQVRFNGDAFDASKPTGAVQARAANTISVWDDSRFTAAGAQTLRMMFDDGNSVTLSIAPKPRRIKVEVSPVKLSFGVLDSGKDIPGCTYTVSIEQGGAWHEAGPGEVKDFQVAQPGGFAYKLDAETHTVSVSPAWPTVFTPMGECVVLLRAGTGKPGETAETAIAVTVRDDWRKWLYFSIGLLVLAAALAYAAAISLKKRIPMELDVFRGTRADMSDSVKVELVRDLKRRNLWPSGRETASIGLLELYPDPKSPKSIVLSSVCVQHGLTLDGKPPQYYKARDKAGDFVIGPDTIVGIREDGAFKYYRFINHGLMLRKAGNARHKALHGKHI